MASNDEPLNVIYITSSYPQETYVYDGLKASKINVLMDGEIQEVKVNVGDYVEVKNYQHDDPVVHEWANDPQSNGSVWYVYTANKTWLYAGAFTGIESVESGKKFISGICKNIYNCSGHNQHYLGSVDAHLTENEIIGNTENTIVSVADGWRGHDSIEINDYDPNFIEYGVDTYYYTPERTEPSPKTTQAQIGDYAELSYWDEDIGEYTYGTHVFYQYPGVWVPYGKYPDLNVSPILPVKPHVQIKWTDPQDITDWKPTPATWEGTVIVRKENTPPLHRWDGIKVVRSTTRDEYKTDAYKDEDVKTGKVYYYGFFPYYTKFPDPDHPIRFYTFTKYIRVETGVVSYAPVINSIETNADTATINYTIIAPTSMGYATARLYGKIGSNPACDETDDIMLVVDQTKEEIEVTDLLYDTQYNFCIQVTDNTGEAITSNVVSCTPEEADPGADKWKNVKYGGSTVSGWKPVKLDSVYLVNNGYTDLFDHYCDSCDLDETKITDQGVDIVLQTYIDIGKTLAFNETYEETIYSAGKFDLVVHLLKILNNRITFSVIAYNKNHDKGVTVFNQFYPALESYDGQNKTLKLMLLENANTNIEGEYSHVSCAFSITKGITNYDYANNHWYCTSCTAIDEGSPGDAPGVYQIIHGLAD